MQCEVPLATYLVLQIPRAQDVDLFRYGVGWPLLSRVRDHGRNGARSGARSLRACEVECLAPFHPREYARIRANTRELRRLQERRFDDAE